MPQIQAEACRVSAGDMTKFCSGLLRRAGLEEQDALLVAESLVESNLRGIDSHGVARLSHYLDRIAHGSIKPRPELRFTKIAPALGLLDGGHGLGQIVMSRAANEAMGLARDAGAGWVAVRNSSHCGALAFYCKKIADEGMIGVAFTHADSMVIPFAAGKPFCGTNPICVTAPSEDGNHLCLDMATSIAPGNSVMNAALEGLPIPGDWGIDDKGRSTTDPKAVIGLHPFGSYKGSGLGLVIDVLCSLLSGAPYGPDIPPMYGELDKNRRLGGLIGVIDPSRFEDISQFRRRVHEMLRRWQALPAVDPTNPVLFPGQPELITRQERLKTGIPLGPALMKQLASVAGDLPLPWAENHRDTD